MTKTTIKLFFIALPVMAMVSCKPTLNVSSDYDRSANFSTYKTFSLYYLISNKNVNELNENRIWNSIRAEMMKKGYKENDQQPDIILNAVSVVKNRNSVSATTTGYGYGGAYRPYGYRAGMATGTTTFQKNSYKEGSLVIDVIDFKTNKLIWQGTGSAEFEKAPKNPDEAVTNAVTKILANFPHGIEK